MRRSAVAFFVSAILVGVVAYAQESSAFFARQESSDCHVAFGPINNANDQYRFGCNESTSTMILTCGVEDTGTNPKNGITTFNVHINSQSTFSSSVGRCVNFFNAPGSSCGTFVSSSGFGMRTLSPPTFAGWNAADFGFIEVIIPAKGSASTCVKGYFTAG